MSTPYSALMDGSSTVLASNDRVSAPTGGSQIENRSPAKKPARGWNVRAIQVYQPPADGNTFASCAAFRACSASSAPPNRKAHRVTIPAKPTMKTNEARIANDGAIVAIPCISIPGRPTAFSRNSVLTVPWPLSPVSIATVHPFLSFSHGGPVALHSALPGDRPEIGEGHSDLRCLAAVYRENRAGHVRCIVGGQECR